MTISRGEDWGRVVPRARAGAPTVVRSDREAGRLVETARRGELPVPPMLLRGGDLARTVGWSAATAETDELRELPLDLGRVRLDGQDHWFVAHLVARRRGWRGPVLAVMNAQFRGRGDVAPRGHPNDGRLDVVEVDPDLPWGQRIQAWRRLPTGTHVPHPAIHERRVRRLEWQTERALDVWLDGERVGRAAGLTVDCEPDAWTAFV